MYIAYSMDAHIGGRGEYQGVRRVASHVVQPLMIDSAREEQKMAGSPQYMRRGASILERTSLGKGSRSRSAWEEREQAGSIDRPMRRPTYMHPGSKPASPRLARVA